MHQMLSLRGSCNSLPGARSTVLLIPVLTYILSAISSPSSTFIMWIEMYNYISFDLVIIQQNNEPACNVTSINSNFLRIRLRLCELETIQDSHEEFRPFLKSFSFVA